MAIMQSCLRLLILVLAIAPLPCAAASDDYPLRPIRLVVPFPPGGILDLRARQWGPKLAQALGQPVVVDNRPGASGAVAAEIVARAAPDGYTLLVAPSSILAINPSLFRHLPYDPVADFTAVAAISKGPMLLTVAPSLGAATFADFVALAKRNPSAFAYGSAGIGTPFHVAGEMLNRSLRAEMTHVPYKGDAQALTDLLSGQIQAAFQFPNIALPLIEAGKLRALMVTSRNRLAVLPDVPSAFDLGLPELEIEAWHGIVAPARTPAAVVARLNAELNRILRSSDFATSYTAAGAEIIAGTPEAFADFALRERAKWARLVKLSGASLD